MYQIHDNILQYELSIGMKFSNLGHDLLFRVMTLIDIISYNVPLNLYMSSQCQVISHLYVMTYLFDTKCMKFMVAYIFQYEIPPQVKFSNLGHDLLF